MEFDTGTNSPITDEQRRLAQTRAKTIQPVDPFLAIAPSESISDADQYAVFAIDVETTTGNDIPTDHIGEHTHSAGQQVAVSITGLLCALVVGGAVLSLI